MNKKLKSYVFTVELRGIGLTEAEAWIDATEQFSNDTGEPQKTKCEGSI